jgi:hypothetical protein
MDGEEMGGEGTSVGGCGMLVIIIDDWYENEEHSDKAVMTTIGHCITHWYDNRTLYYTLV